MSVTPIEQVSSDRISSVISRLPFAKRARAVRPNDNPHPSLVALPAKAGIPLRADHDRRARSTERIEALAQIGRAQVGTPVTNAHIVCRLLLVKKKQRTYQAH